MSYRGQVTVLELHRDNWRVSSVAGDGNGVHLGDFYQSPAGNPEDVSTWVSEMGAKGFSLNNVALLLDGDSSSLRYHSVPPVPSWRLDLILRYDSSNLSTLSG